MPSNSADRSGRTKSICHRLPPRLKFLLALTVVAVGVALPADLWPIHGVLACVVFLGHTLARVPLSDLGRRLALFVPMVFLLSISLPLTQGFAAGWDIMAAILLRSILAFLAVLWLINVMPFDQLLLTLRRFRVPETLVAMLAFMYRYSFLLWDELRRMQTARRARSFGTGGFRSRWKGSVQLIGMLLIRAMSRGERVHRAMLARGWDGRVHSLDEPRGDGVMG